MKIRDVATGYIYVPKENEVLLQKKTLDYPGLCPGGWFSFGGGLKKHERPIEGLLRELQEELGVTEDNFTKINQFLTIGYITPFNKGTAHVFELERPARGLHEYIIGEGAGIAYFNYREVPNIQMNLIERGWINKFIQRRKDELAR